MAQSDIARDARRLAKKDYVAEALRWFARRHPDTGRWHPAFRSESEVPDYLTPDEQRRAITEAITEHEGNEKALSQLRAALAELDAEPTTTEEAA
jgi:dienelactone hydrolase